MRYNPAIQRLSELVDLDKIGGNCIGYTVVTKNRWSKEMKMEKVITPGTLSVLLMNLDCTPMVRIPDMSAYPYTPTPKIESEKPKEEIATLIDVALKRGMTDALISGVDLLRTLSNIERKATLATHNFNYPNLNNLSELVGFNPTLGGGINIDFYPVICKYSDMFTALGFGPDEIKVRESLINTITPFDTASDIDKKLLLTRRVRVKALLRKLLGGKDVKLDKAAKKNIASYVMTRVNSRLNDPNDPLIHGTRLITINNLGKLYSVIHNKFFESPHYHNGVMIHGHTVKGDAQFNKIVGRDFLLPPEVTMLPILERLSVAVKNRLSESVCQKTQRLSVPGHPSITHLTTPVDLYNEGIRMRHCIGELNYAIAMVAGTAIHLHVDHPEVKHGVTATLSKVEPSHLRPLQTYLILDGIEGHWVISDIYGYCNNTDETIRPAMDLLNEYIASFSKTVNVEVASPRQYGRGMTTPDTHYHDDHPFFPGRRFHLGHGMSGLESIEDTIRESRTASMSLNYQPLPVRESEYTARRILLGHGGDDRRENVNDAFLRGLDYHSHSGTIASGEGEETLVQMYRRIRELQSGLCENLGQYGHPTPRLETDIQLPSRAFTSNQNLNKKKPYESDVKLFTVDPVARGVFLSYYM